MPNRRAECHKCRRGVSAHLWFPPRPDLSESCIQIGIRLPLAPQRHYRNFAPPLNFNPQLLAARGRGGRARGAMFSGRHTCMTAKRPREALGCSETNRNSCLRDRRVLCLRVIPWTPPTAGEGLSGRRFPELGHAKSDESGTGNRRRRRQLSINGGSSRRVEMRVAALFSRRRQRSGELCSTRTSAKMCPQYSDVPASVRSMACSLRNALPLQQQSNSNRISRGFQATPGRSRPEPPARNVSFSDIQFAALKAPAVDLFHRESVHVDAIEASDIDGRHFCAGLRVRPDCE